MAPQKASFKNLETGKAYEVQFNPTELNLSKSAQFAEIAIPGLDAPVQQFIHGGTETMTVELFFDQTDQGMAEDATSVTEQTDDFYALVKQNRDTHAPPRCLFVWAPAGTEKRQKPSLVNDWESQAPYQFVCIVESVERKFLLFSPEGIPIRARLTLKLREYQTVNRMVARLQSADHTKVRVFERRQRLDQIASKEYNSPGEWRRIAEANNIEDPRRIPPGAVLQVPPMQVPSFDRRV